MNPQAERLSHELCTALVPLRALAAQLFCDQLFAMSASSRALFDGKPIDVQHEKFLKTVDTLVQMLGVRSTLEVKRAWSLLYLFIAGVMNRAAVGLPQPTRSP